jgi:hypothetical protein
MLNINVVSRPKIQWCTCFSSESSIMYREIENKNINRNCVSIQPTFSAYTCITYKKTKSTIRKRLKFWSRNNIKILHLLTLYLKRPSWSWSWLRPNVQELVTNVSIFWLVSFYLYFCSLQDLYCVRSDLGNLLKALGRLDEAKVRPPILRQRRERELLENIITKY